MAWMDLAVEEGSLEVCLATTGDRKVKNVKIKRVVSLRKERMAMMAGWRCWGSLNE